jgi:hypothetical protein
MKTSTAKLKTDDIVSTCCSAGFTKMVVFEQGKWTAHQTCASCSQQCEVEYAKHEKE